MNIWRSFVLHELAVVLVVVVVLAVVPSYLPIIINKQIYPTLLGDIQNYSQ